jgi:uncharacterized protein (UPF0254 family)
MIKIATAECFTHGQIGREIHNFIQNYKGDLKSNYLSGIYNDMFKDFKEINNNLTLISVLFLPNIKGLEKLLNITPPKPYQIINGVKVYKENEDKIVSSLMANAIKEILDVDIGIGTTAGIGKGGITISTNSLDIVTSSDVYADLRTLDLDISLKNSQLIFKRQESGVIKTLKTLLYLLNHDLNSLNQFKDIKIIKK